MCESKTKEGKGNVEDGGKLEVGWAKRIKKEGEVMKTGAREVESLLIFRTIFLLFPYSLMFTFLQLHNSVFLLDPETHSQQFSQNTQRALGTRLVFNI